MRIEEMMVDYIYIEKEDFLKALEIPELEKFILWIENTLVEKVSSKEELIKRTEEDNVETIVYSDDVEFEVYTLQEELDKHAINYTYKEAELSVEDEDAAEDE